MGQNLPTASPSSGIGWSCSRHRSSRSKEILDLPTARASSPPGPSNASRFVSLRVMLKSMTTSAAASVSAVIGGSTDVGAALAAATRVFRFVSWDVLAASDFDSNVASTELNKKAQAARLGEIDFFLSHSWQVTSPA